MEKHPLREYHWTKHHNSLDPSMDPKTGLSAIFILNFQAHFYP